MPALIAPALVSGLGVSLGTATTIATAGLYVATTAASIFLQMAMMEKPEQEIGTKLDAVLGGAVNQSIHFGRKESAGSFLYKGSWGRSGRVPNAFLTKVFCVSDRAIDGYEDYVWVDGIKCNYDPGETQIIDGVNIGHPIDKWKSGGENRLWVKFYTGSQSDADPYLLAKFGTGPRAWTADHVGRGRAYFIVTQKYDKKNPTGEVEVLPVVKNANYYDWRNDSTNGGSGAQRYGTDNTYGVEVGNPVVDIYNVMRGVYRNNEWIYGGQKWPATRFDNASWTAAANKCDSDVNVSGGGTIKFARLGAEVDVSEEPWTVIERMLKACNGRIVESGGKFKIYCGGIGASVHTFTDDDVILSEELTGRVFPTRDEIANTVNGTYTEPDNSGEANAYKPRTKSEFVAEDGDVRKTTLDFEYVRDNRQAQRLANLALKDNRRFRTFVVAFWSWARKLEPCDVVSWTSDRFQFTTKKFIVGETVLRDDGIVIVNLREADAADADWNPITDEDPFETGVFDDVDEVAQTFTATVTAVAIKDDDDNDRRPAIRIQATLDDEYVDCEALRYQVRKKNGDQKILYRGRSKSFFEDGNPDYGDIVFTNNSFIPGRQVQVRYKVDPESDRETEWSDWATHELTLTDTPEVTDEAPDDLATDPTMTLKTRVRKDGTVSQKILLDQDLTGRSAKETYRIRVVDTTETPDEVTKYDTGEFPFPIPVMSDHSYEITVAPVSRYGVRGNFTGLATGVTMPIPKKASGDVPAVSGFSVDPGHKKNVLEWDPVNRDIYPDYAYTLIAKDNSNTFPSPLIKHKTGSTWTDGKLANKETKYYRIRHFDTSGNPGPWSGIINTTTNLIDDGDLDDSALAAPTGLTLTKVQDRDEDGKVQTFVKMECTAPGWFTDKSTYVFEVTVGSDVFTVKSDDAKARYRVQKTNVLHSVRVRGVKGNGNKGTWTSAVTITPSKKTDSPTVLSSLTALAKPNSIRLYWNASLDSDFKESQIYRNTVNNSGTATLIGSSDATYYRDDTDLVQGQTYYYWVRPLNFSGVQGSFSSAAFAVFRGVEDTDTDAAGLAAPTGLALTKVQDRDEDGKIQTYVKMECTAPAGATANTTYVFEITVGADVYREKSDDVKKRFLVQKTGVLHSVRVRAIKGVGTKGTWSTAVTITPAKKAGDLPAPGTVTLTSLKKRINIDWSDVDDDTYPDYAITFVWRNTTGVAPTPGTTAPYKKIKAGYLNDNKVTTGTTYYYWIAHKDNSRNFSALSSVVSGASGGDEVTDFSDLTGKVKGSQIRTSEKSNLIIDEDMLETTPVWTNTAGGAITSAICVIDGATSQNQLSQPVTTAAKQITHYADIAVKGGKQYFISVFNGPDTAVSCTSFVLLSWYKFDGSGNKVFIGNSSTISDIGTTISEKSGVLTAPADARRVQIVIGISAGPNVGHIAHSPILRRAVDDDVTAAGLAAPTGLTLTRVQDTDDDGTVKTFVKMECTAPAGATGKTTYEFEVTVSGDVEIVKSGDTTKRYRVQKTGVLHSVRVRAVIGVGSRGAWTSAVTITPAKKTTAPATVAWEAANPIVRKPKGIVLRIQKPTENDIVDTVYYRNTTNNSGTAVEIGAAKNNRYKDDDELIKGTTYYYWAKHRTRSDVLSASFSTVQSIVYKGVETDDIEDDAVTIRKRKEDGDRSNMVADDQLSDPTLWIPTGGAITQVINDTAGATSKYAFTQAATTADKFITLNDAIKPISVKGGKQYFVSGMNGPLTAVSCQHLMIVQWLTRDGLGALTYLSGTNVGITTSATITDKSAVVTAPASASACRIVFGITAGANVGHWAADPVFRKAVDDDLTSTVALAAPSALTLTKVQDTDEDGTIRTFIKMECTAPAGASSKTTYEFEVTVGSDVEIVKSGDTDKKYRVQKTGVLHSVRVRAVMGVGNRGTWSTAVTITPTKKATGPATLTSFTATARPNSIKLRWAYSSDVDISRVEILRNTVNTYGTATYVDSTDGSDFKDDSALVKGTTYYYWVRPVNRSGIVGTQSASASAVFKGVDDTDTDDTSLAAPTGLSLSKGQIVDEDGTVRTFIKMECTAPGWATAKTDYEFEVTTNGDVEIVKSGSTTKKYRVQYTNHLHSVRVRGKNGVGNRSAWTTAVTITPGRKGATASAIVGISINRKNGVNVVKWNRVIDRDNSEVQVERATDAGFTTGLSILGTTKGTKWRDDENITKNVDYFYRVVPIDTSGNVGSAVSSTVVQQETGVTLPDTNNILLAAPTGISLVQRNLDVDKDGTVDIAMSSTFSGTVAGAADYECEITPDVGTPFYIRTGLQKNIAFKAVTTMGYRARWATINWQGQTGPYSGYVGPVTPSPQAGAPATPSTFNVSATNGGFQLFGMTSPTENDYAFTEIASDTGQLIGTVMFRPGISGTMMVYYPTSGVFNVLARHVNTSGLRSAWRSSTSAIQVRETYPASFNIGTSASGSVSTPSSSIVSEVTLSWICDNSATGVSLNIGGHLVNVDFVINTAMSRTVLVSGGGSISASKASGQWRDALLIAKGY